MREKHLGTAQSFSPGLSLKSWGLALMLLCIFKLYCSAYLDVSSRSCFLLSAYVIVQQNWFGNKWIVL